MITFTYISGESKTGEKGPNLSHYQAHSTTDFDGVGNDPLEAMIDLAISMDKYITDRIGKEVK